MERPKEWEVVCKVCMSGGIMSDAEVEKRLHGQARNWPTHCGQAMRLRRIEEGQWSPKEVCTDRGCCFATYGNCSCSCRGRFHGRYNEARQFNTPNVKPLPWYRRQITQRITFA